MNKKEAIFSLLNKVHTVLDQQEKSNLFDSFQKIDRPTIISFLNAHALNCAYENDAFLQALKNSDILLRDGFGMEILMRLFNTKPGINMNGTDMIPELIHRMKNKKIVFCGTRIENIEKLKHRLTKEGIQITQAFDGFQPVEYYIEEIKKLKPEVLVLGMGMPKQEILSSKLKEALSTPCLIINGGAIIDFLSGAICRAPVFIRRIKCEWIFRLILEPRRLWKRYLIGNLQFLTRILSLKCYTAHPMNNSVVFEQTPCPVCEKKSGFWATKGSRTDIYINKLGFDFPYSKWSLCKTCGMLFQNPRPTKEHIEKLYTQNQYFGTEYLNKLKRISIIKHRDKVNWIANLVPHISKNKTALDMGCGIGGSIKLLTQMGFNAYGVEPDPIIAAEGVKEFSVPIKTGLFNDVEIPANSIDLVYSNHVFEHLADPNRIVEKIRQVTTKNAYIFTCIPTYKRNTSLEAYAWMNLSHNYIFTKETLERLFAKFGFNTVQYKYNGSANELWMLSQKNESVNHDTNLTTVGPSVLFDYYVGIPVRSFFLAPKRGKWHWSYLAKVNKELGAKEARKELFTLIRTPLADTYRVIKSFGRSLKKLC